MGITIKFKSTYILSTSTVGGKKEKEGRFGSYYDKTYDSLFAKENNYEDAEKRMTLDATNIVLKKAKLNKSDIDLLIGGDLLNQITNTTKVAETFSSSFIGTYGACATSILSLGIGSIFVSNKLANKVLIYTSSNYGSVERQFRYPTSYGIKKKDTTTLTVSGSASLILTNEKTKVKVTALTLGKSIDSKTYDASDMGSIMARAAYDTLLTHITNMNKKIEDYDYILTGDLGVIGLAVFKDMLSLDNYYIDNIFDAGAMIFDLKKANSFSGGSGPACLPLVAFSYVYNKLLHNEIKSVLLIATGALHSKTSVAQKNNVPVIAHAIELKKEIIKS